MKLSLLQILREADVLPFPKHKVSQKKPSPFAQTGKVLPFQQKEKEIPAGGIGDVKKVADNVGYTFVDKSKYSAYKVPGKVGAVIVPKNVESFVSTLKQMGYDEFKTGMEHTLSKFSMYGVIEVEITDMSIVYVSILPTGGLDPNAQKLKDWVYDMFKK